MKFYMDQIQFPVVGIEWMEDSFRSKLCKYPYDYALNQFSICRKASHEHSKKMKSKLDDYINR